MTLKVPVPSASPGPGTSAAPVIVTVSGRQAGDLVTIDVSFISVLQVIAPAAKLAKTAATFVILIKPQFELPRDKVGPGGIVKSKTLHERAVQSVRKSMNSLGLRFLEVRPSRVPGAEGNQEYFLHARKNPGRIANAHGA